jgi:plastocyanin
MKRFFVLMTILALAFAACEQPTNGKLPNLTIKNDSSFDLTDVKFSGLSFSVAGSSDLPRATESVKQLRANDVNKAGYITFTRKDIGIACRTAVSIGDQDVIFTFLDSTEVEEAANSGNKKSLSQISFISQVTVGYGSLNVAKNETLNLGETVVNDSKQVDFVLKNTGVGKLLLSGGTEPVKISSTEAGVFSVVQPSGSEAAPGASMPFKINFAPKAVQTYTATVTIGSNDQNGDFTFSITAIGVQGITVLELSQGTTIISHNVIAQQIDFGQVEVGSNNSLTFTIKNTGNIPLALTGTPVVGTSDPVFAVSTQPTNTSVSPGASVQFTIRYTPAAEGQNTSQISISNNSDTTPFLFTVKGNGYVKKPIVGITYEGADVPQNGTIYAGEVLITQSKDITVWIKNTGEAVLMVDTTNIAITGTEASAFTVISNPAVSIQSNSLSALTIKWEPTKQGENNATLTIPTNDDSRNPVTVYLKADGVKGNPVLELSQGITMIPHNNNSNRLDFGQVAVGSNKSLTFTIKNTGNIPLELTGPIKTANPRFAVTTEPANTSINPGDSVEFIMTYMPLVAQNDSAQFEIPNNSNITPFLLIVEGNKP